MLAKLTNIRYSKVVNEQTVEETNRTVLITDIPRTENIKGIDLSDVSDEQQLAIESNYNEYVEYLNAHMKLAFSFEDWLSHTKGVDFTPKWRTFKPEQTVVLP